MCGAVPSEPAKAAHESVRKQRSCATVWLPSRQAVVKALPTARLTLCSALEQTLQARAPATRFPPTNNYRPRRDITAKALVGIAPSPSSERPAGKLKIRTRLKRHWPIMAMRWGNAEHARAHYALPRAGCPNAQEPPM